MVSNIILSAMERWLAADHRPDEEFERMERS